MDAVNAIRTKTFESWIYLTRYYFPCIVFRIDLYKARNNGTGSWAVVAKETGRMGLTNQYCGVELLLFKLEVPLQ
jgi:hypothetical protein